MRAGMVANVVLLVVCILLVACLCNVVVQNVYCGTPICSTSPFSLIPCEPVDKIMLERKRWEALARDCPAE